jgi:predicted ABC-type ATPase
VHYLSIVAGPNGAGKTRFAEIVLPVVKQTFVFLNADEIAKGLRGQSVPELRLNARAGRHMLVRVNDLVDQRHDMLLETTLAGRIYANHIPRWRQLGYYVKLYYLRLPSVEASIERVRRRVADGGHDIPLADLNRRYARSLENFETIKTLVDEWYLIDSLENDFKQVDQGSRIR